MTCPISQSRSVDISNPNFDGDLFISKLDLLNVKCTRGGTSYKLKPATFHDDMHPGCIIRLSGSYLDKDVTTAFFIQKRDLYNGAFTHECNNNAFLIGSNWTTVPGSLVKIKGSVDAPFVVSYDDSKKKEMVQTKDISLLQGWAGREILLRALYNLKYGSTQSKSLLKVSYHSICHHLCEAARLTAVSDLVRKSFNCNQNFEWAGLRVLFNKWSKLSKMHRNVCLGRLREAENVLETEGYAKLGLTTLESVEKALKIVLMENEGERVVRRRQVAQRNSVVWKYYEMALYTQLEKRNPCWQNVNNVTWKELKAAREQRLKKLMDSGVGDPDIWKALYDSLREPDPRYAKYKIQYSDVNLIRNDISEAVDDKGFMYKFKWGFMLTDPIDGCKSKRPIDGCKSNRPGKKLKTFGGRGMLGRKILRCLME